MSIIDKIPYEKMENSRFLELNGVPVPKYKSKGKLSSIWRSVVGHIDTPEILSSIALTLGAATMAADKMDSISLIGDFFLATIMSKSYIAMTLGSYTKSNSLHFDTNPSKITPKIKNYILAKGMRGYCSFAATAFVGVTIGLAVMNKQISPEALVLFGASALTYSFNAYRFNKVIQNKWQITDTIPEQEEKEVKTSMVPTPA